MPDARDTPTIPPPRLLPREHNSVVVFLGRNGSRKGPLMRAVARALPSSAAIIQSYTNRSPDPVHDLSGEFIHLPSKELRRLIRDGELVEWRRRVGGRIYGRTLEMIFATTRDLVGLCVMSEDGIERLRQHRVRCTVIPVTMNESEQPPIVPNSVTVGAHIRCGPSTEDFERAVRETVVQVGAIARSFRTQPPLRSSQPPLIP